MSYAWPTKPKTDCRSGGQGAKCPAGAEQRATRLRDRVRDSVRGGARRRRDALSRVHQEDEDDEGGAADDDAALPAHAVTRGRTVVLDGLVDANVSAIRRFIRPVRVAPRSRLCGCPRAAPIRPVHLARSSSGCRAPCEDASRPVPLLSARGQSGGRPRTTPGASECDGLSPFVESALLVASRSPDGALHGAISIRESRRVRQLERLGERCAATVGRQPLPLSLANSINREV